MAVHAPLKDLGVVVQAAPVENMTATRLDAIVNAMFVLNAVLATPGTG